MLEQLSFRRRIIIAFVALILIPSILLSIFAQLRAMGAMRSAVTKSAVDAMRLVTKEAEARLSSILSANERVFLDSRLLSALNADSSIYPITQQMEDLEYLRAFIRSAEESNRDIYRIRLFVPPGRVYSNERINFLSLDGASDAGWFPILNSQRTHVQLVQGQVYPDHEEPVDIVSFGRSITVMERFGDTVGIVTADVLVQTLEDLIARALVGGTGAVSLQADDGTVFASVSRLDAEPPDRWSPTESNPDDPIVLGSRNWIRLQSDVGPFDVTVEATIPLQSWIAPIAGWRVEVLLAVVLVTLGAIWLAFRITRYDVSRIEVLSRAMNSTEDSVPVQIEVQGDDEIASLYREFNALVERLRGALEAEFRSGQEAKSAELLALQSQINPHFLYNTLDMLKWNAAQGNTSEIEATIDLLSAFYRRSLRAGEPIVTVGDELEHVETYARIQNLRFDNAIQLGIYIPQWAREARIVRITLQPLVENSIIHGILERQDRSGSIALTARRINGDVEITVRDDGIGMSEEKAKTILNTPVRSDGSGFGVHNVDARLRLTFGESYGLSYTASAGEGTTARVLLPG